MTTDATPSRILVREVNWLGDLVLSLPALKAIRRAFPSASLSVLVREELAGFFDGFHWLDEVVPYRVGRGLAGLSGRIRVVRAIRSRCFDLAVLFPRSFESALWAALAGVPRRVGFVDDARGPLLTRRVERSRAILDRHQVYEHLDLLRRGLEIDGDAAEYGLDVHPPHRARMRAWLEARRRRRGKLVALAPGAAYGPAKEWPVERYAALVDLLAESYGAECVLVGAPSERERAEQVAAASRAGALVAAGETSVGELLALLSLTDGFAGNDSGAMHLAGALGVPTVGVFGSTRPWRTSPLGPKTHVVYHPVPCSPCMARRCRYGHYECLTGIAPERVLEALDDLGALGGSRSEPSSASDSRRPGVG